LGSIPGDAIRVVLVQAGVGLAVFAALTWLVGVKLLHLRPRQLRWLPPREGLPGLAKGFLLAALAGFGALALGLPTAGSTWRLDGASFSAYLVRLVMLAGIFLPAALQEELSFRCLPLVLLDRDVGRAPAVMGTALLFAVG